MDRRWLNHGWKPTKEDSCVASAAVECKGHNFNGQGYRWLPGQFVWIDFYISSESNEHMRQVYNLLDLTSDLGGVLSIVYIIASIIVVEMAEHSFIVRAF